MTAHQDIPFYENTSDDTHCFQASFRMVLKYFLPEKDFTFKELDDITAKKESLWTWPFAGSIWMRENNFEVKSIDCFNFQMFIEKGGQYIIDEYGAEVGEAQIKNSNIAQERKFAKKFLSCIETEARIPQKEDIQILMSDGYINIVNLNVRALNGREGYAGHSIVITGFDDLGFWFHDPGLPGIKNRYITSDIFEKAWSYPSDKAKNILAFRLKK